MISIVKPIKVLFLAAEADPLVKICGLRDVAGSLLAALGSLPSSPDVWLILPPYPQLRDAYWDLKSAAAFNIPHSRGPILTEVFQTTLNGVIAYLVNGALVFESPAGYCGGSSREGNKFTFFFLAAMELVKILN